MKRAKDVAAGAVITAAVVYGGFIVFLLWRAVAILVAAVVSTLIVSGVLGWAGSRVKGWIVKEDIVDGRRVQRFWYEESA